MQTLSSFYAVMLPGHSNFCHNYTLGCAHHTSPLASHHRRKTRRMSQTKRKQPQDTAAKARHWNPTPGTQVALCNLACTCAPHMHAQLEQSTCCFAFLTCRSSAPQPPIPNKDLRLRVNSIKFLRSTAPSCRAAAMRPSVAMSRSTRWHGETSSFVPAR